MATNQQARVYATDVYEPMRERANVATLFLWLCATLALAAVVSDYFEYSLLGRIERGDFTSTAEVLEDVETTDDRQETLASIQVALSVVTGVVFIWWFYGMYKNLKAIGRYMRFSPGWAIGGWFVPILGFWRPKQIADDLYRESDPSAPPNDFSWTADRVPYYVHWWWATWLLSVVLWRIAAAVESDTSTLEHVKTSALLTLLGDALSVVAAVLAVRFVRAATARQEQWADKHLGQQTISSPS